MTQQISVTLEDIENGIAKVACKCPIARALHRTFPDSKWSVAFSYIRKIEVWVKKEDHYECSKICQDFIINFDNGKEVKPFTFEFGKIIDDYDE